MSQHAPYRHVVLFQFKPETPAATVQAIETAFHKLCTELPLVAGFEWGLNSSPEGLDQGFTHCFLVTFASPKERDQYLPHPAHQKFVKDHVEPNVAKVCVVDYEAR